MGLNGLYSGYILKVISECITPYYTPSYTLDLHGTDRELMYTFILSELLAYRLDKHLNKWKPGIASIQVS